MLHFCDTPLCVNPDHLFLGTQADNVADCIAKGRRNTSKNAQRLSMSQAVKIRKLYKRGGISSRKLGKQYNVSHQTILNLVHKRTYNSEET